MINLRRSFIIDANVLIDFARSDLSILGAAAQHLGDIYILSTVLDEVSGLDENRCSLLGICIFEPELAHLLAAGEKPGRLSIQDHLCLALARENGWTCVTNDRALREACRRDEVSMLWGLQLILELVQRGALSSECALKAADEIHRSNPAHITHEILSKFIGRVRELDALLKE